MIRLGDGFYQDIKKDPLGIRTNPTGPTITRGKILSGFEDFRNQRRIILDPKTNPLRFRRSRI